MNLKEALIAHLQGEKVECKAIDSKWSDFVECFGYISMGKLRDFGDAGWEFRLAPRTITVNGREVPEPVKGKPIRNSDYYCVCLDGNELFCISSWTDHEVDVLRLQRGLIHLTKEAAIAHAKAMLGVDE